MFKKITAINFRRFGRVIEYPGKEKKGRSKNLFRIVLSEEMKIGWRIAYLIVRDRAISRLEHHPDSFESFEPVRGKGLLYVVDRREEDKIECFFLDKPVILNKGIWHGVLSLGPETEIKLTENCRVKTTYWRLKSRLYSKGAKAKQQNL